MVALVGLIVAIVFTDLSIADIFASLLAFLPTGWAILSVSLSLLFHVVDQFRIYFIEYRFSGRSLVRGSLW